MINRVRNNTDGQNAEDMMRGIAGDNNGVCRNYTELMQYFDDTLEKNPEIGGIIGYSEGASIAATYLLEEQRRLREEGRPRRIKCGIFITGWPAMTPDKGFILADEDDEEAELIDVPTLHVVGAKGMDAVNSCYDTGLIVICWLSRSLPTWVGCPLQYLRPRYSCIFRYGKGAPHSTSRIGGRRAMQRYNRSH